MVRMLYRTIPIDLGEVPLLFVQELAEMVREEGGSWPGGVDRWLDSYSVSEAEIPPPCGEDDCLADWRGLAFGLRPEQLCHYCRERYIAVWIHRLQRRLEAERAELAAWRRELAA